MFFILTIFLAQNGTGLPSSPKGHQRSQSDGTVMSANEEVLDSKKEQDKKSVKTIFSQFLPSSATLAQLTVSCLVNIHYK